MMQQLQAQNDQLLSVITELNGRISQLQRELLQAWQRIDQLQEAAQRDRTSIELLTTCAKGRLNMIARLTQQLARMSQSPQEEIQIVDIE